MFIQHILIKMTFPEHIQIDKFILKYPLSSKKVPKTTINLKSFAQYPKLGYYKQIKS